jgi:cytidylate kinase
MIITLDGPSGTGKSTLAKILADKLGYKFLNSGMIYRAVTYYFLQNNYYAC